MFIYNIYGNMCVMCGLCEAVKFVCISVGKKEIFFFIYIKNECEIYYYETLLLGATRG